MKKLNLLVAATLIISLSSCTTVKFVPVAIPLPPPLQVNLTEEELACLSDTTYDKIVLMDKRIITLENIIKSTHSEKVD